MASVELTQQEFMRLANNFYTENGLVADVQRMALDSHLINYFNQNAGKMKERKRVALCCICLNPPYWEFIKPMIDGAKSFFLPGHDVDYLIWSDLPHPDDAVALQQAKEAMLLHYQQSGTSEPEVKAVQAWDRALASIQNSYQATVFPTEPVGWPLPTLYRYSLMLQQEEKLREYDYVFYCDIDMLFVNVVGDEVLGNGLTAAQHPMYALRKEYWPPYEPNEKSSAYIPRPGRVINEAGRSRFMPLYFAGGLQGGKTQEWVEAMKTMKRNIDSDFNKLNYVAIWNDETHWNRYLFDNPPDVVLTPSYIYPDSLIREYYEPLWGCSYQPKLVTLTKKFTTSTEGGQAVGQMIEQIKVLQK